MIDDDIMKIEKELGSKVKTSIIVLIHELSFIASTREEKIGAYEALDKWSREHREYQEIRDFADRYGSKLIGYEMNGLDSPLEKVSY